MKRLLVGLMLLVPVLAARSQDTLRINLHQADSLFIRNSYYLLAGSMNVEAQRAQILQAQLYPNPVATADLNAYDPGASEYFHVGRSGQKVFILEQLIILGGKRKSEIEMARTNAVIAELEFQSITRQLKFVLHSNLFAIGQQHFLIQKYNHQLALLDDLLHAFQVQADKGNVPVKDLVRLKGAYLRLNNDRAELLKDYYEAQSSVQKILQVSGIIEFQFTEEDILQYIKPITYEELRTTALENRPDFLILKQSNILAAQYLRYQRQQVIPDVNLFTSYDQRGGAFQNQVNAGVSVPLPLWNRNQGNIKSSRYKLQEASYTLQAKEVEIGSETQNAFALYNQTIAEYNKAFHLYNPDFDVTFRGMTENFQKRNVSIIEFIDFFEAYNDVLTELVRIKTQLVTSAEGLNQLAGKDIY